MAVGKIAGKRCTMSMSALSQDGNCEPSGANASRQGREVGTPRARTHSTHQLQPYARMEVERWSPCNGPSRLEFSGVEACIE